MSRYLRKHNAVGNLVQFTDAKSQVTTYAYDILNRLVTNLYPSKTVSFAHDAHGRMTSWSDGAYSGSFAYDDVNRTRTVSVDYGPFTKSFTYHYDISGRKTSFTGPDGIEISYGYSSEGNLNTIAIPGEGTIAYSMNQYGQLYSQTLPGGNIRQYGYNPRGLRVSP